MIVDREVIVCVEWEDSFGCSPSWSEISIVDVQPLLCESIGRLMAVTDTALVVVPHLTGVTDHVARQGCGDMTIPLSAVRKVTELRGGRQMTLDELTLTTGDSDDQK